MNGPLNVKHNLILLSSHLRLDLPSDLIRWKINVLFLARFEILLSVNIVSRLESDVMYFGTYVPVFRTYEITHLQGGRDTQ
jgi:hypothetical protein